MRKLIPFLISGLAAVSFSAFASDADQKANAGADVRGDANPGAGTAADNAVSEKKGNEVHGATSDSHKQNPKKQAKRKKGEAGAGATTGERKY